MEGMFPVLAPRSAPVVAKIRSFPALACCSIVPTGATMAMTSPAMVSVIAGATPR